MISKYNEFFLEKEFNSIISDFFMIVEDVEGKWTSPSTIEWDYSESDDDDIDENPIEDKDSSNFIYNTNKTLSKLKEFLKKLPKEKIKEYYIKTIDKFKNLPTNIKKKLITAVTGVFLTFVSIGYLTSGSDIPDETKDKKETVHATFEKSQKLVKISEAGYSDDKGDTGNWLIQNNKRVFIGTNHGISAPILAKYFKEKGIKRQVTKKDMMRLSYKTALKIFKRNFWDKQNLGVLKDQSVANIIYDGCVNQGVGGMKSVLKRAFEENGIRVSDKDIVFSKKILLKANKVNQKKLFNSIKKFRREKYKESRTFRRHGEGWLNRLNSISYISDNSTNDRT